MSTLAAMAPGLEVYSIDEAFLDLRGVPEPLSRFGRKVRATVAQQVGIPVGVGIGPTKTLAKLANWCAKRYTRGGVAYPASAAQRKRLLRAAAVDEVWGIGRRLAPRLAALGVTTAWDLAQQAPENMRRRFSVAVERVVRELRGECCFGLEEMPEPRQTITCSRSFSERVEDRPALRAALATFVTRAAEKLRAEQLACRVVHVHIRTGLHNPAERKYHRRATVALAQPEQDTRALIAAAMTGLERIYSEGYRYLKAGVELTELSPAQCGQFDLFGDDLARSQALMRTLDSINRRMGRATVRMAAVPDAPRWRMRQTLRSPAYLSRWEELRRVD